MAQPKKQRSQRKTGLHRSHLVLKLARQVNGILAHKGERVRAYTTKRESGTAAGVEKVRAKKQPQKKATKNA